MGQFVDNIIAYKILNLLVTPFENTDAFKLGIIDKNGKELKPMSALHTVQEREAYTLLHRSVFRIKKIILINKNKTLHPKPKIVIILNGIFECLINPSIP